MAVPLHRHARELAPADDDDLAVVLFELLDEGDEVAVATDDHERVDVIVGERHLEGIERHCDVGAVLVATGREVALDHPDGVLREEAAVITGALPVAVRDLGHDLAAFLDGLEHEADVELAADGRFHTDLDVVEVDENRNFQSCVSNVHWRAAGSGGAARPMSPGASCPYPGGLACRRTSTAAFRGFVCGPFNYTRKPSPSER